MPYYVDPVAAACGRRMAALNAKFSAVGLVYPSREIFLRVFKQEGLLELWARDIPGDTSFRLVSAYPVQRASGRLGPKRREGDGQVPEGIYAIDRFNDRSLFHLSLGLDYPNASDRVLTVDPAQPGFDIFIHGGAESAGCLAMGDAAIEEIYLAAADARIAGQTTITVQIFPCRLNPANWEALLAPRCTTQPALAAFWRSLQPAYDIFEQTRRLPLTTISPSGAYLFSPPVASAPSDTLRMP